MKKFLRLAAVVCVVGFASWFAPSAKASFCNTTGFLVCDTANGTSCGVPGMNRRCVAPGVCEWGVCLCQNGTWNCFY
ncbi:MAG TPA: hypothetical protein VLV54_21110 [Thermoanaerobaculia bacterium]|nr:hypothetical protein [Thermoanaerobaculia bacterium]